MKKSISLLLSAFMIFISAPAFAAFSPLAVSIVPPVQFPPEDFTITGVRLSLLYGRQRDVYGFDFGVLGNITNQTFVGTAVSGLFNINHGMTDIVGIQAAAVANWSTQKLDVYGVQVALTNIVEAESSVNGLQLSLANMSSHTTIRGFQVGVYNVARSVYGFQVGLINVVDNLHGLQLGLLNFNHTGLFAVAPVLNFGF
jgi:hypothetical protein